MTKTDRQATALEVLDLRVRHADGEARLDPNDIVIMAIGGGMRLLRPLPGLRSVLSGAPAVEYRSGDLAIALTPDELTGLVGRELEPHEARALQERYGDDHDWHGDFYDQRTWEALQPKGIRGRGR